MPHWRPLVRPRSALTERATSEAPLYSGLTIARPPGSVSETIGGANYFNAAMTAKPSESGPETSDEPDGFSVNLGISKRERRPRS